MSQTLSNCDCNDYALLTANTGIAVIDTPNSSLAGVGAILVITGAAKGTVVRSVIIKNAESGSMAALTNPLLTGMVRLFIGPAEPGAKSLYREIPIPTFPTTCSIPYPVPVWPLLEIDLVLGLKLQAGFALYASTQNGNTFNIIAQGVDISYPDPVPAVCCSFKQEIVLTGIGTVSTANPNTDGGGAIVDVYTVPTDVNGAVIKAITVAALGCTHPGMVRFYISPDDGTTYYLWMEVYVPETIQSGFTPSFKQALPEDFYLQADYIIAASTQNAESFAITIEGEEWVYPS